MKSSLDSFFTPADVADKLAGYIRQCSPSIVLDPSAGDGALLSAAAKRWPEAEFVAVDCDPAKVQSLQKRTEWNCSCYDFLDLHSGDSSFFRSKKSLQIDVVLLNPPYSARGNARWMASLDGFAVRTGRAMAFVLRALDSLREGGEIAALLPSSTLTSQRDSEAWELIRKIAQVDVIDWFPRGTFRQGTAVTVGTRIERSARGLARAQQIPDVRTGATIRTSVVRGCVPVHSAKEIGFLPTQISDDGVPFIHTTDFRNGDVTGDLRTLSTGRFASRSFGPSVLLPRVGKPLRDKIVLWRGGPAILSDCVFAIESSSMSKARAVRNLLLRDFSTLSRMYCGSCAPYLTVASLVSFLYDRGFTAHWTGPVRWATPNSPWQYGAEGALH